MMWLCDKCGASLVRAGKEKPLVSIYGANEIPFKPGICENCQAKENLMPYPRAEKTMFGKEVQTIHG